MLVRRLTSVLVQKLNFRNTTYSYMQARAYGVEHEIKQQQWREKEEDLERSNPSDDPELPKTFLWFPTAAPKEADFSFGNIRNWYKNQKVLIAKRDQKFIPERHEILGPNLATAHFIIRRGGKVKFIGNTYWTKQNEKDPCKLPFKFDAHYILEAVDVNGIDLHYEGLSNLCSLKKLKLLSLKNCKNIDDWGLDKISAEFPELQYLDVSGCVKITERGLESLYRMFNLKTLIVTNHYKSVAFELTCMMLEDCIPGLICEIQIPEDKPKE